MDSHCTQQTGEGDERERERERMKMMRKGGEWIYFKAGFVDVRRKRSHLELVQSQNFTPIAGNFSSWGKGRKNQQETFEDVKGGSDTTTQIAHNRTNEIVVKVLGMKEGRKSQNKREREGEDGQEFLQWAKSKYLVLAELYR